MMHPDMPLEVSRFSGRVLSGGTKYTFASYLVLDIDAPYQDRRDKHIRMFHDTGRV
jgi:hypothetical protein